MSNKQENKTKADTIADGQDEEFVEEQELENDASGDESDDLLIEQQQRINELEEEINQIRDTQLRKAADLENFKKRLQREKELVYQSSRETSVEAFLPVYDDLLRTLDAMVKGGADSSYIDGIKLVASKFEDVLKRYNVERIDETGVPFNVDLHDALMRQKPDDDSIESGTVLQVFENGYKMGEKTLRHAKVIVSE